ncbi:hypothetical protein AB1Y20_020197 [Prymnesium parvum]|uniref:Protein of centriole 5 n=1 Tax=Prymnesium parvum TaxID=97485 RepID=A0AB34JW90_PRYPA
MSVQWIKSGSRTLSPAPTRRPPPRPAPRSPRPASARDLEAPALAQQSERRELVAGLRADAARAELQDARAHLAQIEVRHKKELSDAARHEEALKTELAAAAREGALVKARLELAERELRELRQTTSRQFASVKRSADSAVARTREATIDQYRRALHSFAHRFFTMQALAWSRGKVATCFLRWCAHTHLLLQQLRMEAALLVAHREDGESSNAHPVNKGDLRHSRARRVARAVSSLEMHELLACLHHWKLVSVALVESYREDEAGSNLEAMRAAVLNAAAERENTRAEVQRTTSIARCLVSRASRHGARRLGRDNKISLQWAFWPWVAMVLDAHIQELDDSRKMLQGSKAMTASLAHRADARAREIEILRATLATTQKKMNGAQAELRRATQAEARACSERDRFESLTRSSQARSETMEREMRSSASAARRLKQTMLLMRRGIVGLALETALTRGEELLLAAALNRWRWLVAAVT